ncbi:hypothetical protein FNU79_09260 [Deinococcus detaillensis]|uniref:Uncharacterized protein n=1 Tax=Deinococcus detaillensis TaxID=2592048 RepID=A0A553UZJ4_9DEIO|nr:hypothetical protein [Deinococcus detaillensis]TSA85637.1 hypothetical protein FNU79_09260 [Deinococcus detaillensis]
MAELEAAELRELVRQMYAASADNKRLLSALLEDDSSGLKIKVTQEIEKAFGTAQSQRCPSLKTGAARTALQHYAKFAPPAALVHAELDFVEAGLACMECYGDVSGSARSSLESMWQTLMKRCLSLPRDEIPWTRLRRVEANQEGCGWGFLEELEGLEE